MSNKKTNVNNMERIVFKEKLKKERRKKILPGKPSITMVNIKRKINIM
jgi:hypothetical protein